MIKGQFSKAKIFKKYLAIRFDRPLTIFLACLFPFLQAFISSIIVIYTDSEKSGISDNLILFISSVIYYITFIANIKRSANGSKEGLWLLVIFGSLGIVAGKLII